jgi:hypothetical protein
MPLTLYDVAGPYVALQAYAGILRDDHDGRAEWVGQVGLRGLVGAEAGLWSAVASYQATPFDLSRKVPLREN